MILGVVAELDKPWDLDSAARKQGLFSGKRHCY